MMLIARLAELGDRFEYPELPSEPVCSDVESTCMITGKKCFPLKKHPIYKVDNTWNMEGKGVVGGKLISCNEMCFRFYTHKQGSVVALSPDTGKRYAVGHSQLLRSGSHLSKCIGQQNLWVCFWTEQKSEAEYLAPLIFGTENDKSVSFEDRKQFFKTLRENPDAIFPNCRDMQAYMCLLENHKGRCAVLAYSEATVDDYVKRLVTWNGLRSLAVQSSQKFKIKRAVVCDFINDRSCKQKKATMFRYVDKTNTSATYAFGCNLAIAERAAKLAKAKSCVQKVLASSMVRSKHIHQVHREFLKHIDKINKNVKFTSMGKTLRCLWKDVPGSLSGSSKHQVEISRGYIEQKRYVDELNLSKCSITEQGLVVRSYGEKQLAELLNQFGLPFYYELQTVLKNDSASYRIPDFTIFGKLRPTYIEYMNCPHDKWEEKKAAYEATDCNLIVVDDREFTKPRRVSAITKPFFEALERKDEEEKFCVVV